MTYRVVAASAALSDVKLTTLREVALKKAATQPVVTVEEVHIWWAVIVDGALMGVWPTKEGAERIAATFTILKGQNDDVHSSKTSRISDHL